MDKGEGPDDWNKCEPWGRNKEKQKKEEKKYMIQKVQKRTHRLACACVEAGC